MTIAQRTHDEFYLRENHQHRPKEYFKFLVELTRKEIADPGQCSILDIGCASGDFLYFLRQTFPNAKLYGADIMPSLVEAAKTKVPEASIVATDINGDFKAPTKCDVVYMAGVHSIFDTCDRWVKNISGALAKNGTAFVFGLFNPHPYDVLVKVRKAGSDGAYEAGWNSISQETVAAEFKKHGLTTRFVKWDIPIDIAMNEQDTLRSWTTPLADGTRMVSNASRVIHDFTCAIVTR